MSELKLCPFCGGAAHICYGDDGDQCWVECGECACSTGFCVKDNFARELWNRRASEIGQANADAYLVEETSHGSMLFFDRQEACTYCNDDEQPIRLFREPLAKADPTAAKSLNPDAKISPEGMMTFAGVSTKPLYVDPLFGQMARRIVGPIMPRELLAKIVDEVFDGAIEDTSVIEDIYRVFMRESEPAEGPPRSGLEMFNDPQPSDLKPQAQTEPKPDKVVAGYTPGIDSMSIETAEGQEPVAWLVYQGDKVVDVVRSKENADWISSYGKERVEPLYAQPQRPAVPDSEILTRASSILVERADEAERVGLPDMSDEFLSTASFLKAEAKRPLTAAPAPKRPETS